MGDYDPSLVPPEEEEDDVTKAKKAKKAKRQPRFFGKTTPYERAAIFPWGQSNQRGPNGEKVVSARAIKHVRELTAIATGERSDEGGQLRAAVLFVVVRSDVRSFRPNVDACPSFARY